MKAHLAERCVSVLVRRCAECARETLDRIENSPRGDILSKGLAGTAIAIAPVIERSGKSQWVHRRFGRPKFICETFHEFAFHSLLHCPWAREFYRAQRRKGKSSHSAIRSLAFKWIRIIYACWKTKRPYDQALFLRCRKTIPFPATSP
jgi:hypothetical protein